MSLLQAVTWDKTSVQGTARLDSPHIGMQRFAAVAAAPRETEKKKPSPASAFRLLPCKLLNCEYCCHQQGRSPPHSHKSGTTMHTIVQSPWREKQGNEQNSSHPPVCHIFLSGRQVIFQQIFSYFWVTISFFSLGLSRTLMPTHDLLLCTRIASPPFPLWPYHLFSES